MKQRCSQVCTFVRTVGKSNLLLFLRHFDQVAYVFVFVAATNPFTSRNNALVIPAKVPDFSDSVTGNQAA